MKRAMYLSIVLSLVLVSCGLKVPVTLVAGEDPDVQGGGATQGPLPTTTADPDGDIDPGDVPTAAAPSVNPTATGAGGPSLPIKDIFDNDTEGITNSQITLCTHVPITGAAPVTHHPNRFGQFYFDYVNQELGGVHGRKVRFIAYDDKYYPAGARDAVEKCARQGSFIYLGAAGTDQIVSVAKWAEGKKVPYMHGPTSIKDLGGFAYNVHAGPSYEFQHELLARYLVERYGADKRFAMIRVNSPYFEAGHDAFVAELAKLGVSLVVDKVVEKDEQQFTTIISELKRENVDIVNNFTTPNIWLRMLPQARAADYKPVWTAVSPVAGFNIVAPVISGAGTAVVFHHFNPACNCTDFTKDVPRNLPWYDDIQEFLRIFRKYSPEQNPPPDDFDYSAYLAGKAIHRILLQLGPQPTRGKLFGLLESRTYKEKPAAVAPGCPADFSRNADRMGAWYVNVFELSVGKWKQIQSCVDKV